MWSEQEIVYRENLIREIPIVLKKSWCELNPIIQFERCETPILVPASYLDSHISKGFELINTDNDNGYLRPETTIGTITAFNDKFPIESQMKKRLPYCMWQVGCSFRNEKNADGFRATKLRLKQFYQIEFQLFASSGTHADYLNTALDALIKNYGGEKVILEESDLPHYSSKTIDWEINGIEVASCSQRMDWQNGIIYEVAIGLDRLVSLRTLHENK
jgi:hypothetical protein